MSTAPDALTTGTRYAITYTTGKRVVGTVYQTTTVAGVTHYKLHPLDGAPGWFAADTRTIATAINLDAA